MTLLSRDDMMMQMFDISSYALISSIVYLYAQSRYLDVYAHAVIERGAART